MAGVASDDWYFKIETQNKFALTNPTLKIQYNKTIERITQTL